MCYWRMALVSGLVVSAAAAPVQAKNCTRGCSCGDTCISCAETCHVDDAPGDTGEAVLYILGVAGFIGLMLLVINASDRTAMVEPVESSDFNWGLGVGPDGNPAGMVEWYW